MGGSSLITALNNDQLEMFVFQWDLPNIEEAGRAALAFEKFQATKPKMSQPYVRTLNMEDTDQGSPPDNPSGLAGRVTKLEKGFLLNQDGQHVNSKEKLHLRDPATTVDKADTSDGVNALNRTRIDYLPQNQILNDLVCVQSVRSQDTGGSACPEKYNRPCQGCGQFGHWIRECPVPGRDFVGCSHGPHLEAAGGGPPPAAAVLGT